MPVKPDQAPAPVPAQPPQRRSLGLRPDLATIAGLLLALAGILGGLLLEKGKLSDIAQGTAAMIVLGGTVGAVLITNPLPLVLRAAAALQEVLLERSDSFHDAIDELIGYATNARKNGIVS